ncbi:MAG: hypothetical protein WA840_12895 [Caulobacteraceae bacterium]
MIAPDKQKMAAANAAIRKLLLSALPGLVLMITAEYFMAQTSKAGAGRPETWELVCLGAGILLNAVVVLRFRKTMRAIGLKSARRPRTV